MMYKGYLLDIDNTLYDYEKTHTIALETTLLAIRAKHSIDLKTLHHYYNISRKRIHSELMETASSHNRLLYFQRMFEALRINSMTDAYTYYEMYWSTFINNMQLFDNVYDFLDEIKHLDNCLLTDLTADVQFRKVEKLGLQQFCKFIVTSEEAGKEKPHPYMFMLALGKLQLQPQDVCMVGDSYSKDIVGATNLGIRSYWLNHKNDEVKLDAVTSFTTYKELLRYIK